MSKTKTFLDQIQNSITPGSIVTTNSSNEQTYLEPGLEGQILTIVNGIPTYSNTDDYIVNNSFNTDTFILTSTKKSGDTVTNDFSVLASDRVITGGTYDSDNGIITFVTNSGNTFDVGGFVTGYTDNYINSGSYSNEILTLTNVLGDSFSISGFTSNFEGYSESGTRAGGDLVTTMGDYDNSNNGSKVIVDDANELIENSASIIRLGKNLSGTTANTTYVDKLNVKTVLSGETTGSFLARDNNGNVIEAPVVIPEVNQDNFSRTITVYEADLAPYSGDTVEVKLVQYINDLNYNKLETDSDIWVDYVSDFRIFTSEFDNTFA